MDLARDEALESRKKNLFECLFLMAFWDYANALANGFVYDDHLQIKQNSRSSADAAREFDQTLMIDPSNSEPQNALQMLRRMPDRRNSFRPLCYSLSESFVII